MSHASLVGNFNYPAKYRIGAGRILELAQACIELGIERPLIVTDPGIRDLVWFAPIVPGLEEAGLTCCVFSEIEAIHQSITSRPESRSPSGMPPTVAY